MLAKIVIVALAIAGALIVVAGSIVRARATGGTVRFGQLMVWAGYAVSGTSVLLFIVAGFVSG